MNNNAEKTILSSATSDNGCLAEDGKMKNSCGDGNDTIDDEDESLPAITSAPELSSVAGKEVSTGSLKKVILSFFLNIKRST